MIRVLFVCHGSMQRGLVYLIAIIALQIPGIAVLL